MKTPSIYGENVVVRIRVRGVFCTYKNLSDGTRKAYWYHRATGKKLRGQPGSPEFIADYSAAEQTLIPSGDTFNTLVRNFTTSVEFGKLASSTQIEYRRMLTKAEDHFGDMPVPAIDDARVRKEFLDWRERIAKSSGEREADHRLSAISAMFTWAKDRGHLSHNHVRGFKRLYHSNRAELIWLPEHITQFMLIAPIEMQRALIIALHTGQRQGDILRLPWSSYDGKTIQLKQGKATRKGVKAPTITVRCTKALRKVLDSLPRKSPVILTTKTGQAFKKRWFASRWKSAMVDAGIQDLHFNDIRGTAITMLSEAGNTVPQIAAVTGHSLKTVTTILEKYLARTRHLSDAAIDNFENSPRTKFANRLQTKAPQGRKRNKKP